MGEQTQGCPLNPVIIAGAQIGLSAIYIIGYFVMLWAFLRGHIATPPEWKDQLGILLGVLTAGVGTILGFWFSRSREATGDEKV